MSDSTKLFQPGSGDVSGRIDRSATRFVSRLTHETVAVVLAGGRGSRLGVLTDWRTKPAVPFGAKFRIIDFALSNCLNSGINKVAVLTQYKSHSLIQHLMRGWGFLNSEHGGLLDILPAQQWNDDMNWYQGTADAVYQCLDILEGHDARHVLILAGDHVYNMDYGEMLAAHVSSGAAFSVACYPVPLADASEFGVMKVDASGQVIAFSEKPKNPEPMPGSTRHALASMGIYVASRQFLEEELRRDADDSSSSHDFGKDIIPSLLARRRGVYAYTFHSPGDKGLDYWRDVGTIDAYYQAHMEMISPKPPLDLYDRSWPVRSYLPQLPPCHFIGDGHGNDLNTVLAGAGCVVEEARIRRSILFTDVRVGRGSELDGVVVLPGSQIGAGCRLRNVIVDNQCRVPDGTVIGHDSQADQARFLITEGGITVVNRRMLGQGEMYIPGMSSRRRSPCGPESLP